jgi:hypothetical protein
MMTFDEWFEGFDIYKIDPYTNADQFEIEIFLRCAWAQGYIEGYAKGVDYKEVNNEKG